MPSGYASEDNRDDGRATARRNARKTQHTSEALLARLACVKVKLSATLATAQALYEQTDVYLEVYTTARLALQGSDALPDDGTASTTRGGGAA